jgi:hypothetical protein
MSTIHKNNLFNLGMQPNGFQAVETLLEATLQCINQLQTSVQASLTHKLNSSLATAATAQTAPSPQSHSTSTD